MKKIFDTFERLNYPITGIYLVNKNTDTIINEYLTNYTNLLYIYNNEFKSNLDINDLSNINIYKIIRDNQITNKCQFVLNKFIQLVQFGSIDFNMYEMVIFRLLNISTDLAACFSRIPFKNAKVIVFVENISENDTIFLGLPFYKEKRAFFNCKNSILKLGNEDSSYLEYKNINTIFKLIHIEPKFNKIIEEYLPLRLTADEESQKYCEKLEKISFYFAFKFLNLKYSSKKTYPYERIKHFQSVKNLLFINTRFNLLVDLLYKTKSVVVIIAFEDSLVDILKKMRFNCKIINYKLYFKLGTPKNILEDFNFIFDDQENLENVKFNSYFEEEICEKPILIFVNYVKFDFNIKEFQRIYYLHKSSDQLDNFTYLKRQENEFSFCNFLKEKNEKILNSNFFTVVSLSIALLKTFFHLVKFYLADHFWFILQLEMVYTYEQDNEIICILKLPSVHSFFKEGFRSKKFLTKKLAQQDISFEVFKLLYENGFMTKNFFPTPKFLEDNYLLHIRNAYSVDTFEEAKEFYDKFITEKCKNCTVDYFAARKEFKKKYSVRLDLLEVTNLEIVYPESLSSFPETYSVYVFDENDEECEWDNGICCNKGFNISNDPKITYLFDCKFTKEELNLIFFFQVVFFGLHFKRLNPTKSQSKSCYFFVPIKNRKIHFEFLENFYVKFTKESYLENPNPDFLIFNPLSKRFFVYYEECPYTILDKVIPVLKEENKIVKWFFDEPTNDYENYANYLQEKYEITLEHIYDRKDLLFHGKIYVGKREASNVSVLSSEIMQSTCVKKDIYKAYKKFQDQFFGFLCLNIAEDLRVKLKSDLDIKKIRICLTPNKGKGEENYERVEFLGDSILKYYCTKLYFLQNKSLEEINDLKIKCISNENLIQIAQKYKIDNCFTINKLSPKSFQPPNLFNFLKQSSNEDKVSLGKYISYFEAENTFLTGKIDQYSEKIKNNANFNKPCKTYADIVEALIGMHYLEFGFEVTFEFIHRIGIIDRLINQNISQYFDCKGFISKTEVKEIEEKIKYKFKAENQGLLEKVFFHPSFQQDIGSVCFQNLELIGDSALDLIITIFIFHKYPKYSPEDLHFSRKSLVNNFSYGRVLRELGLFKHIRTCFDDKHLDMVSNLMKEDGSKINKLFADIFEALCGAVLIDCKFDLEIYKSFVMNLIDVLLKCADITR